MNIFDLSAKITLDEKGFIDGIKNANQKMTSFAKSVGSAASTVANIGGKLSSVRQSAVGAFGTAATAAVDMGEKISSVGDTAVKAFAGITTAVGGAALALTKSAVNSYADYEQLVGGVETLFKDSAGIVEGYANNAYKTAGISANQYMETVTSFSASLLQSLGGDTDEAAKVANVAITDMADNANKMGTSMDMIQNAYQGFAKQNYTMLDNLKLGYGGTKTEMERLIADANAVKEANGEMADLSIESFADVTEAIHIIQTEMGITGTTAKEAASTISGSAASMKSAWQNLMTGLADGTQDIDKLVGNLVDSASTYAGNLLPRIKTTLSSIRNLIEDRIDEIAGFAGDLVVKVAKEAPKFIKTATDTLKGVIKAFSSKSGELKNAAVSLFDSLKGAFTDVVGQILPLIEDFVPTLAEKFLEYKETVFGVGLDIVMAIVSGISENAGKLATAAMNAISSIVTKVTENIDEVADAGLAIVGAISDAVIKDGPRLISAISDALVGVVKKISSSGEKNKLKKAATTLFGSLTEAFGNIVDSVLPLIEEFVPLIAEGFMTYKGLLLETGIKIVMAVVEGIADNAEELATSAANMVTRLIGFISDNLDDFLGAAEDIISTLGNALIKNAKDLGSAAGKMIGKLVDFIVDNLDDMLGAAEEILTRLVEGLTSEGTLEKLSGGAVSIITSLIGYIAENLPSIAASALDIIVSLVNGLTSEENLERLSDAVPALINGLMNAIIELSDPQKLGSIIDGALALIMALVDGLLSEESIEALGTAVPQIIQNLIDAVVENAPKLLEAGIDIIEGIFKAVRDPESNRIITNALWDVVLSLIQGIIDLRLSLAQVGKDMLEEIFNGFSWDKVKEWGGDMIDNFTDGIKEKWDSLKNTVSDIAQSVKDFLGFSEPKKGPLSNFHTYAPDMMELFAKGIRDNEDVVLGQIEKSFDFGERTLDFATSYTSGTGGVPGGGASGNSFGDIVINISGANYSDEMSLAEAIAEALQIILGRREAALA